VTGKLLWQGYNLTDQDGHPVTDEEIEAEFERRYGYKPAKILRDGGGVKAGPIDSDKVEDVTI
jgi:hypothetical protein